MNYAQDLYRRLKSLGSFLAIPLMIVALFLILAAVIYKVDAAINKDMLKSSPILEALENLFGDRQSTRSLLGTIASALITVTSITFSLLLVAVQQAAGSFSNQILQQFRARKSNQFYFGFFVGLSLYTLITLATVRSIHHPLFGAVIAIALTVVALLLILVLIYTTIEQMRGSSVINAIVGNVRKARDHQAKLFEKTRRHPRRSEPATLVIRANVSGTVNSVDLDALTQLLCDLAPGAELVICATEGIYIGHGDRIAELRCDEKIGAEDCVKLEEEIRCAIAIGGEPQLEQNPHVGLDQLATIAWNNTSTAVSNPHPPTLILRAVRDLVWEWSCEDEEEQEDAPVVYPDLALKKALELMEATAVASAESKQPQTLAELYEAYAALLPRLDKQARIQVEEAVRLSLGALPEHFPTQRLNAAMDRLEACLRDVGSPVADRLAQVLRCEERDGVFAKESVKLG